MRFCKRKNNRRGASMVEVVCVVCAVALTAIGGYSVVGTTAKDDMEDQATSYSDPSKLTSRFGKSDGQSDRGKTDSGGKTPSVRTR